MAPVILQESDKKNGFFLHVRGLFSLKKRSFQYCSGSGFTYHRYSRDICCYFSHLTVVFQRFGLCTEYSKSLYQIHPENSVRS